MIIPVTENWRITSDSLQWKVEKQTGKDKKTGEDVWSALMFYSSFEQARKNLTKRLVREIDAYGLEEAIEKVEQLKTHLDEVFEGH